MPDVEVNREPERMRGFVEAGGVFIMQDFEGDTQVAQVVAVDDDGDMFVLCDPSDGMPWLDGDKVYDASPLSEVAKRLEDEHDQEDVEYIPPKNVTISFTFG